MQQQHQQQQQQQQQQKQQTELGKGLSCQMSCRNAFLGAARDMHLYYIYIRPSIHPAAATDAFFSFTQWLTTKVVEWIKPLYTFVAIAKPSYSPPNATKIERQSEWGRGRERKKERKDYLLALTCACALRKYATALSEKCGSRRRSNSCFQVITTTGIYSTSPDRLFRRF